MRNAPAGGPAPSQGRLIRTDGTLFQDRIRAASKRKYRVFTELFITIRIKFDQILSRLRKV